MMTDILTTEDYELCSKLKAMRFSGMAEALEALLEFGFQELHMNRIEAQHEVDNPASGRVMAKVGMQPEGILRSRLFNKGRYVDVALYAILRGEWQARCTHKQP